MIERLTGFADEASDTIEGQVAVLKELGWSSIELRAVNNTLVHDLDQTDFDHVLKVLENNEISVACLGSSIANWGAAVDEDFEQTEERVKRTISRMKRLNTRMVRIMSYKLYHNEGGLLSDDQKVEQRIERLNYICQSFLDNDLIPVHENCYTYGGLSYEHTLYLLDRVPGLKLVFDTGNPPLTVDGRAAPPYPMQDAYEFYSHVKDHIVHVHIKDAKIGPDGKEELFFFPGEGDGQIPKIVGELEFVDRYTGYYSIEPHMEVVFHDSSAVSTEEKRMENFITYGRKFENVLRTVGKR
ncbi:MAG: sugar phosphate isomerase/epimerase [Sphaerochaetaceae bacterium]|nr:sugar phosphate isomerase/epimerase [Sphaerochaetaceae bacterium]